MKTLNNKSQVLNIHYRQALEPDTLNKIFHQLFTPGVIDGTFTFTPTSVTISSVSFLIHPQNQPDIIVRIDTTESVTLSTTASANTYLIARYRWENANHGADLMFIDDTNIVETDVILVGLVLDTNGRIRYLDYDVQERARLNLIQLDTIYPLVSMLDGYRVGHSGNKIPISDGELNEGLNAEYWNGKEIVDVIVSKELPEELTSELGDIEEIIYPEYPEWMDTDAVDAGEGVTAEYVGGYKMQPQDGTTRPKKRNKIPAANTILQKDLNAEYIQGYPISKFAKVGHQHSLDDILDDGNPSDPTYYRVLGVDGSAITADSIESDDIDYRQVEWLGYDSTTGNRFQPVYETGEFTLTATTAEYQPFSRLIRNARVILQRAPGTEVLASGGEKRTARIVAVNGTSGFTAKQMGSIVKSGTEYKYEFDEKTKVNQYFYLAVGEIV